MEAGTMKICKPRTRSIILAGPACPGCGMTHGMVPNSPGVSMLTRRPLGLWPEFAVCLHCRRTFNDTFIVSIAWARLALLVARSEVPYTCAGCARWLATCCCEERPGRMCKWCDAPIDGERPWHCEGCYNIGQWDHPGRADWARDRLASGLYTHVPFGSPAVRSVTTSDRACMRVLALGFFIIRMAPTSRQLTAGPYPRPVPGAGIVRWWQPDDSAEKRWYGMPTDGDRAVIMLYAYEVAMGLGAGPSYYPLDVCYAGGMTELDIIRQAFGE